MLKKIEAKKESCILVHYPTNNNNSGGFINNLWEIIILYSLFSLLKNFTAMITRSTRKNWLSICMLISETKNNIQSWTFWAMSEDTPVNIESYFSSSPTARFKKRKEKKISIPSEKLDMAFKCCGLLKRAANVLPLWLYGCFS